MSGRYDFLKTVYSLKNKALTTVERENRLSQNELIWTLEQYIWKALWIYCTGIGQIQLAEWFCESGHIVA